MKKYTVLFICMITLLSSAAFSETEKEVKLFFKKQWSHHLKTSFQLNKNSLFANVNRLFYLGQPTLKSAVFDDIIYTADPYGNIAATDIKNGKTNWRHHVKKELSSGIAVNSKLVVLGGQKGALLVLDRQTGALRFEASLRAELLATPVLTPKHIIVKTFNSCISALSTNDGSENWTHCQKDKRFKLRASSSPAVSDGIVIAGLANGHVVALDEKTGEKRWEQTVAFPMGDTPVQRLVDIDADPIIDDGTIYVVTYRGKLSALSLKTGDVIWRRTLSSYQGITINNDILYVSDTEGSLMAFQKDSGKQIWKQEKLSEHRLTQPAVFGKFLILGDGTGYLLVVSMEDGRLLGSVKVGKSGIEQMPIPVGSDILVLTRGGKLANYRLQHRT